MSSDGVVTDKNEIKLKQKRRSIITNVQLTSIFTFGILMIGYIYYRLYFVLGLSANNILLNTGVFLSLSASCYVTLKLLTNDLILSKILPSAIILSAIITYYISSGMP